jgi:hypothetical protein
MLPAAPEPTPSSVEIPIVFSGETPQSGESIPLDATEFEEYSVTIESGAADTDAMGRPAVHGAIPDTDATGRPAALHLPRSGLSDDQDTMTRARSGYAIPRRRPRRTSPANPDDTLPDENETGETTQLMVSRAPKAPQT